MDSSRYHWIVFAVVALAVLGCGDESTSVGDAGDTTDGSGNPDGVEELAKRVNPGGLALDGDTIYFTVGGASLLPVSLRSVPKSGGEHIEVVSTGVDGFVGPPVLVGEQVVFASSDSSAGTLFIGPLAGGEAMPLDTAESASQQTTFHVASDSTNAYWALDGVYSVPLDGSAMGTPVAEECREPFILDGTTFFCVTTADEIVSVESGSSSTTLIATDVTDRVALAVDATTVYWLQVDLTATPSITRLSSAPRAGGGSAAELWSGSSSALAPSLDASLVLDGDSLYFAAGPLMRYSLSSGGTVPLTHDSYVFPRLAVDASHVYFAQRYTPDIYTPAYVRIARVPR